MNVRYTVTEAIICKVEVSDGLSLSTLSGLKYTQSDYIREMVDNAYDDERRRENWEKNKGEIVYQLVVGFIGLILICVFSVYIMTAMFKN